MTDSVRIIRPADDDFGLVGAVAVRWDAAAQGWQVRRLPERVTASIGSAALATRAAEPSGVRVAMEVEAEAVELGIRTGPDASPVDVLVDGVLVHRGPPAGDAIRVPLAAGIHRVEFWLPQFGSVVLSGLRAEGGMRLAPAADTRPRWSCYGSSIAQARAAAGPTETWPAMVARARGWNLRNLGFGGECHLDQPIARFIRDTPAELISLCVGVNIHGHASLSARAIPSALAGFVETIRDRHPATPLVVISPITAPELEARKNPVGLSLADVRQLVASTVAGLDRLGLDVSYVDGASVFTDDDAHLLVDEVHPGPEGHRLLGRRFAERLFPGID